MHKWVSQNPSISGAQKWPTSGSRYGFTSFWLFPAWIFDSYNVKSKLNNSKKASITFYQILILYVKKYKSIFDILITSFCCMIIASDGLLGLRGELVDFTSAFCWMKRVNIKSGGDSISSLFAFTWFCWFSERKSRSYY